MEIVISTKGLGREYEVYRRGEGIRELLRDFFHRQVTTKTALQKCDVEIRSGDVIGLVGANGAGKTTLLKLLSGLIFPSHGELQVLGFKPWERKNEFLRQISLLLGQKNQLWWDLPPQESFSILARIYDLDLKTARQRVSHLSEVLSCGPQLGVPLRRLSLGERMKMEVIGALLHQPRVLFLDEPTIGLDIVAQVAIRDFIQDYVRSEKPTVILTSHYMDDISMLANRLMLMSQGQIIYDGTVQGFVERSERLQKLTVHFIQASPVDLPLPNGKVLRAGESLFSAELKAGPLAETLQILMQNLKIQEIKIDNVEFEEVIHEFFAELSSRRHAVGASADRVQI